MPGHGHKSGCDGDGCDCFKTDPPARFRIRYKYQPPTATGWICYGDQDAEAWEGSAEAAEKLVQRLQEHSDPKWSYEIQKVPS